MRHPFLRTLAGSAATPTDPNFENVTLLLHGDGTNGGQNNTFVDGSTNNFTITRNGNTTQGTFSPYGDNWSNYFDGTGDYLLTATNAALSVGTGDFTCEVFAFFNALDTNLHGIVSQLTTGDGTNSSIAFMTDGSTLRLRVQSLAAVHFEGTTTLSVGQWYHFVVVRSGTNIAAFSNGTRINSGTNSTNIVKQSFAIGRLYTGADQDYSKAYISNFRLVKGSAVYDPTQTTLTVPTSPLTSITNTSLLTCQSNRFRDASTNNFTITRNGDVSVQRFSPFSPTAAYAAGTIGGSGYFDGTGDYLTSAVSDNIVPTTGDFTAECWFYATASTSGEMFSFRTNSSSFAALRFRRASTSLDLLISTSGSAWAINNSGTVGTVPQNAWNHLAVVRDGGTFRVFANGVSVFTSTAISAGTALMSGTTNNFIGCSSTTSPFNLITGYLADCRVVQSAVYTANFTPPTAPLTAITNTSLLLNFTNAAIVDNAMMAVPETVGNAQISTSVKKYGTGSLYFDGTGDYLKILSSDTFVMGTGDFTVEFWIYIAARKGGGYAYATGTQTNDLFISFDSNGNFLRLTNQATVFAVTGTISLTTWTHIAVVRSSGSSKIYVDGTGGTAVACTINFTATGPSVGASNAGGFPINGYIDDLRVTKGVARYTANFTAPTAAFPDL